MSTSGVETCEYMLALMMMMMMMMMMMIMMMMIAAESDKNATYSA